MRLAALLALSLALAPLGAIAQQAPVARAPFIVERTDWIKPGKELQFIDLFEKNQVPLLQAKMKQGGVLWMRLSRPQFNATNDQWDMRTAPSSGFPGRRSRRPGTPSAGRWSGRSWMSLSLSAATSRCRSGARKAAAPERPFRSALLRAHQSIPSLQ